MKALVLTKKVLFKLSQFAISEEWFENFWAPDKNLNIKRVVVEDIIYLLDSDIDDDNCDIVVINLEKNSPFVHKSFCSSIIDRIVTVGRSVYTDSVNIPVSWRKHTEGSVFSIQAMPRGINWKRRLHFDMRPRGNKDLYVFSLTEETVTFDYIDNNIEIYDKSKELLAEAILKPYETQKSTNTSSGITLSRRLPQGFVQGASLDQWYRSKLTDEQRNFVDKPHDGPVRLRGAAGTGKTLSLVIKFLKDAIEFEKNAIKSEKKHNPVKFGFLTHSSASVDLINSIGESLDNTGIFYGEGQHVKLEVRTLYDLSHKNLNFELDQLVPLSLDGREGRKLQAELIHSVIKDMESSIIVKSYFKNISENIKEKISLMISGKSNLFVSEVMNEFASVLDSGGIRANEEKGERYAKGVAKRPAWLMSLPEEIDRRFVLEIHRRYRKLLGEMNTLSVDQMIGDFNSFLDSNRWDRIRERDGYDVLFVDELHLFTSIERQTLHKLIRSTTDCDGVRKRPAIFMAYDLKQSPRDTFANYGGDSQNLFSASTGLQGSDLVNLKRVFRYTPQISEFLADLDASFPAIDIPGEWDAYSGKAELDNGIKPEITVFADENELFATVFSEAQQTARSIEGGGRRVAVLCASEEMFDKYLESLEVKFPGRYVPIVDRDPSSELRHAGKRFVFSMPEYVAGLQFDTVFLIHVDSSEAPQYSEDGSRRSFISNIYLGSSRAENVLKISSCLSRGGISDILDMALERGSLVQSMPSKRKF
ncbi:uvrD/REP helicase N-terminal domain protein [Gluconobacter frateurii NBRC 101659]|nr:uvrD/REP helicase N-terminal domain protein [Gluconobacter frateurii NBRC 101659]